MTDASGSSKRALRALLLGLVVLLPLTYWLWYRYLEWILQPVFLLVDVFMTLAFPEQIANIDHEGHHLVVTNQQIPVTVPDPTTGELRSGLMPARDFPFDASIAGSGMPLFVALMLLASRSAQDIAKGAFIGIPLMWLQHAVVAVCGVLIHPFFFKVIVWSDSLLGTIADHTVNAVNTLGLFILPALFPLILWVLLYPEFVKRLMPQLRRIFPLPGSRTAMEPKESVEPTADDVPDTVGPARSASGSSPMRTKHATGD